MIDYSKFVESSRKWLSQYIQDNHLQSICVGISGGIDSTVSCAIAKPVCDELNVSLLEEVYLLELINNVNVMLQI